MSVAEIWKVERVDLSCVVSEWWVERELGMGSFLCF